MATVSTGEMVLVGLLIVLAFAAVFYAIAKGIGAKTKLSLADLVKVELEFDSSQKTKVADAASKAAQTRGESGPQAAGQVRSDVETLLRVRLRRVLWVDDVPDNNVYECVALMEAGFVIATATSNDAARRYLAEASFDLVITDLGRGGRSDDGAALVREISAQRPNLPVVVYTGDAAKVRDDLKAAGAKAVEDQPGALIGAVLTIAK
jgi:CheY-like chemotaxis protein